MEEKINCQYYGLVVSSKECEECFFSTKTRFSPPSQRELVGKIACFQAMTSYDFGVIKIFGFRIPIRIAHPVEKGSLVKIAKIEDGMLIISQTKKKHKTPS